jgi:dTDP-glucose pyrophosphorylase
MKINLILLAGKGKRFADAGYKLPKPLIEVDGLPMVVAAARSLPPCDQEVFVVSGDYVRDYRINDLLERYFPKSEIVTQTEPLQGQAHSALQAERVIDPDSILTIGSCDAGPTYDKQKFEDASNDPTADALIWSFRNYPYVEIKPTAFGWIEIDQKGYVRRVLYKVLLSNNPLKDHAVVAYFTYKQARHCFDSVKEMMAKDIKSGPEFSLDECTNVLVARGLRVKVFEIDKFISWGTPDELRTYEYWKAYFAPAKK